MVIVGGGPTGLMLAAELRLGGVDPVVLEQLPEVSEIPKGNGLVGQIVPMLDYRGLREPFAAASTWAGPIPRFSFGPLELDLSRVGVSPLPSWRSRNGGWSGCWMSTCGVSAGRFGVGTR